MVESFLMCPRQPRHRPPDEQLRAIAEDVNYEIGMLVALAGKLVDELMNPDIILHNAQVESFLVHARALYQFFYNDDPWPTDVVAADYLADWATVRPATPQLLDKLSDQLVGKRVVHLTLHRVEREEYPIQMAAVVLLGVIRRFLKVVPHDIYPERPPLPTTGWAAPQTGSVTVTTSATTSASFVGEVFLGEVDKVRRSR